MPSEHESDQNHINECIALGNAAFSKDQLVEATTRYAQARLMIKQAGVSDCVELRHCLKTLGEIYKKRDKPEEALEIIRDLRKLDDTIDNRRAYISLLYQIASAHAKQGDRERAEEAYGEALVEATDLLPANDPLIERLNTACLEFFKRTFKSKKLTQSDTQLKLSKLPTDQPIDDTAKPNSLTSSPSNPTVSAPFEVGQGGSQRSYSSGTKLQVILQSNVLSIGLSLFLIAALVKAALFVPSVQPAIKEASVITKLEGEQFESCDKKTSFCILNKLDCAIKNSNFRAQCKYTVIESKWPDLSSMLRGYLTRDELWYQVNDNAVVDPDKTLLYRTNAPELVIVNKMWWYADFAQKWYHNQHCYPSDVEKCQNLDRGFLFLNPFTKQEDSAAIVSIKGVKADPSWSVRPKGGLAYPHWRPGGISCTCIDGNRFYIHGCDRAGRPLTSSDPQHFFVIECRDGANVTSAKMLQQDDEAKSGVSGKPQRIYICSRPEQEDTIRYFRSLSCILVWLWAIMGSLWCLSTFKLKQATALRAASILVAVAAFCTLAGWYILAYAHD